MLIVKRFAVYFGRQNRDAKRGAVMRKKWAGILIFCMVNLLSTVSAADWVRVGDGECCIDRETAVIKKDLLQFWELSVDKNTHDKRLIQYAIRLTDPLRVSSYWGCSYDANNRPQDYILHTHSISGPLDVRLEEEIKTALTYAQKGEFTDVMPELPDIP